MSIIGPGMTLNDYESGRVARIDVFEGRIKSWTLAFARRLAMEKDSGIAVLLLTSSAFEPMGGVLLGSGNSEAKFCAGFVRTSPHVPGSKTAQDVARIVWNLMRDGLFHESFIKAGLILDSLDAPIREEAGAIYIDPVRLLDSVEVAFADVCKDIRAAESAATVRKNFDAYWGEKQEDQRRYMEARVDPQAMFHSGTTLSTAAPISRALITNPDRKVFEIE
jgi:hypothetical protein